MAAASIPTIKPHKLINAEPTKQDPTKFYYRFLYKALFFTILIILPLFPSQAPEFINQSLLTRNWELLHLLFVGIAISYGLFCRRNDGADKEKNNSKFDTAQSYVSRFLQVSSFFEDDSENDETPPAGGGGGGGDDSKIQTWNNNYQYQRNEPVVVVAPKAGSNSNPRVSEKPLLLPVRSLKSRIVSDNPCPVLQSVHESNPNSVSVNGSGSKSVSRRFSRNAEMEGSGRLAMEDNRSKDDNSNNVVLASPIPWRSESLMKLKQNSRSSRPNPMSSSTSLSSLKKKDQSLSSPPLFPSESLAKNSEDTVKSKGFCKSSIPLPPPPPPPMLFKSISMKPRTSSLNQSVSSSSDKEMKRSFTTSDERKDKPRRRYFEEQEVKRKGSVRFAEEEKVMMGFDEDTESEEDDEAGRTRIVKEIVESEANNNSNDMEGKSKPEEVTEDEGPDVDKKADEFIAKFREQIRLQRIDSIKRSANRMARNSSSR